MESNEYNIHQKMNPRIYQNIRLDCAMLYCMKKHVETYCAMLCCNNKAYYAVYVCMYACMHACMHGWMDGWMDGWMYVYLSVNV